MSSVPTLSVRNERLSVAISVRRLIKRCSGNIRLLISGRYMYYKRLDCCDVVDGLYWKIMNDNKEILGITLDFPCSQKL